MRKAIMIGALIVTVSGAPVLAQGNSGNAGPPAGVGGGMGAGPPISPPGLGSDPSSAARDIAMQRGQFGRDLAERQSGDRLTGQERAAFQQQRAALYQQNAQLRRQEAEQFALAARNGVQRPTETSKMLRDELRADMEAWREVFEVDRKTWQDARDQWLVDRDELTAQQWAQRRADWFVFRDAWIAGQRQWAQARSGD